VTKKFGTAGAMATIMLAITLLLAVVHIRRMLREEP